MEKYIYELKMKVRDYECDLQGIVNNANYQHYLEHTRHEFLTSVGISFARLHEEGVDPVVARLTMAFKTPLRSGDEFVSKLYLKKEGIKYVFENTGGASQTAHQSECACQSQSRYPGQGQAANLFVLCHSLK